MSDKDINFELLNEHNYQSWKSDAMTLLQSKGLYRLVTGRKTRPSTPGDAQEQWDNDAEKAAGLLGRMVDKSLRHHFRDYTEDPVRIWDTLKQLYTVVNSGMRFNAYDTLFLLKKKEDEKLEEFANRVVNSMQIVKDIHPQAFTIDDLDQELEVMAMLQGLPGNYRDWSENLMLQDLNVKTVMEAFKMRTTNDEKRAEAEKTTPSTSEAAMAVSTPFPTSSTSPTPQTRSDKACTFCGRTNHVQEHCWGYNAAKKAYKNKNPQPKPQQASNVSEFGGMAAVCPLPPYPTQPLTPCLVADTGALLSMIPHRSWFLTYEKCRIPIRLPHNKFIYAVGVGSVGFIPKLNGKQQEMVEFTRVLYVPELHNCLLSVLYLTKHRGVSVHIEGGVVKFIKAGELLFTATAAGDENIAYLDGNIAKSHSANLTSTIQTVPLSLDLWHRRLGHHVHTLVSAMKSRDLVTGMALSTSEKPDPICEPCLAGRMNANPFPPSDDKVFRLLERIYSDVPQLYYKTHDRYQYCITFIDAHAKFFVVYLLK